jgi:SPP1 family predicted phage head-tail adaptor
MALQAGMLRKRATIQSRTTSVEGVYGQQQLTWSDVITIWCEIVVLSGAQLARSQSIYNETTHHIITRYQQMFADIKRVGSYRLVYVNAGVTRYFDLASTLNEEERNRMVTILATEGLNDGQ